MRATGDPDDVAAAIIAFVDFTRENGATRVVPGSHRWPGRELSPSEQKQQQPPEPADLLARGQLGS